jgi:glutaredoxin-like YruB-family protein
MNATNVIIAILIAGVLAAGVLLVDTVFKKVSKSGESLWASVSGDKDDRKSETPADRPLTKAERDIREALRNTNNPPAAPNPGTASAPQQAQNPIASQPPQPIPPPPAKKEEKPLRDVRDIQVTLYVTSWCPHCTRARAYLNSQGVNFKEYDIERDPGAGQEMRAKTGGTRGVPVIDIEGIILRGFSAQAISNAIKQKQKA